MNDKLYILRVVKADGTSRGPDKFNPDVDRFQYPESGPVECPDWRDDDQCGGGLHGWLWGAGDLSTCGYWNSEGVKWLVIEVDKDDLRHGTGELIGKCKIRRGNVVFNGARDLAVKFISERAPAGTPILFGTATAGSRGTATAGEGGLIVLLHWTAGRYKRVFGEIGENDLKPNVAYTLDANGKIVEKKR